MEIRKAIKDDIETLMAVRLEMLRVVNKMNAEDEFSAVLVDSSREYFWNGEQTTVLAFEDGKTIGCASISYINIMPTFDHPTGKRAHLMNVYTNEKFRGQGIARKMVNILIDEAKERGCTEISLDATEMGRPLYKKVGFGENTAAMNLELR